MRWFRSSKHSSDISDVTVSCSERFPVYFGSEHRRLKKVGAKIFIPHLHMKTAQTVLRSVANFTNIFVLQKEWGSDSLKISQDQRCLGLLTKPVPQFSSCNAENYQATSIWQPCELLLWKAEIIFLLHCFPNYKKLGILYKNLLWLFLFFWKYVCINFHVAVHSVENEGISYKQTMVKILYGPRSEISITDWGQK